MSIMLPPQLHGQRRRKMRLNSDVIANEIEGAFRSAHTSHTEVGCEFDLKNFLTELCDDAVRSIVGLIALLASKCEHGDVRADVYAWFGSTRYAGCEEVRDAVLSVGVCRDNNIAAREEALLAIASLDDPIFIPVIQGAIATEHSVPLRDAMKPVLQQLEETKEQREKKQAPRQG